jgi:hypothetical protein
MAIKRYTEFLNESNDWGDVIRVEESEYLGFLKSLEDRGYMWADAKPPTAMSPRSNFRYEGGDNPYRSENSEKERVIYLYIYDKIKICHGTKPENLESYGRIFNDVNDFLKYDEHRLEREKEMRIKHKEIDPYGEEVWE